MGDYSVLGDQVDCYCMNRITIGSKVAVSQRAFLCTGSHDVTSLRRPLTTAPIVLENHVWVAAQAFVGPGVTIGEGAVVAACACVVRDVDPWVIAGGNPAVRLKERVLSETAPAGRDPS